MYSWIWRHLPGPTPVRLLLALLLAGLAVLALFTLVFPRLETYLPSNDVTVEESAQSRPAPLS